MDYLNAIETAAAELEAAETPTTESQTVEQNTTTDTPTATDSQAPASATTEQSQTQTTTESTQATKRGPIPLDRHEAVLKTTREEYEAKLARLSWAEKLDAQRVQERLKALELADDDPLEFYNRLGEALKTDPRFAPHFTQHAPKAPVQDDPKPQPDVLLDDGTVTYSAPQAEKLLEWRENQLTRKFEERFGPIEQEYTGQKQWNSALARQAKVLAEARTWEGFRENEKEIAELLKDGRSTLDSAYRRVVITRLKAQEADIRKKAREELIAELNAKRPGSTATPTVPATATTPSFKDMTTEDILRHTYDQMVAAEA